MEGGERRRQLKMKGRGRRRAARDVREKAARDERERGKWRAERGEGS